MQHMCICFQICFYLFSTIISRVRQKLKVISKKYLHCCSAFGKEECTIYFSIYQPDFVNKIIFKREKTQEVFDDSRILHKIRCRNSFEKVVGARKNNTKPLFQILYILLYYVCQKSDDHNTNTTQAIETYRDNHKFKYMICIIKKKLYFVNCVFRL